MYARSLAGTEEKDGNHDCAAISHHRKSNHCSTSDRVAFAVVL